MFDSPERALSQLRNLPAFVPLPDRA